MMINSVTRPFCPVLMMKSSGLENPQQTAGAARQTDRFDGDFGLLVQPSSTTSNYEGETERRRTPRKIITDPLSMALFKNGKVLGTGWFRNVTSNGLFIETAVRIFENPYLQLLFRLPGAHEEHYPWGQVIHQANDGLGLNMDVLEPATRDAVEAVKRFVRS